MLMESLHHCCPSQDPGGAADKCFIYVCFTVLPTVRTTLQQKAVIRARDHQRSSGLVPAVTGCSIPGHLATEEAKRLEGLRLLKGAEQLF